MEGETTRHGLFWRHVPRSTRWRPHLAGPGREAGQAGQAGPALPPAAAATQFLLQCVGGRCWRGWGGGGGGGRDPLEVPRGFPSLPKFCPNQVPKFSPEVPKFCLRKGVWVPQGRGTEAGGEEGAPVTVPLPGDGTAAGTGAGGRERGKGMEGRKEGRKDYNYIGDMCRARPGGAPTWPARPSRPGGRVPQPRVQPPTQPRPTVPEPRPLPLPMLVCVDGAGQLAARQAKPALLPALLPAGPAAPAAACAVRNGWRRPARLRPGPRQPIFNVLSLLFGVQHTHILLRKGVWSLSGRHGGRGSARGTRAGPAAGTAAAGRRTWGEERGKGRGKEEARRRDED